MIWVPSTCCKSQFLIKCIGAKVKMHEGASGNLGVTIQHCILVMYERMLEVLMSFEKRTMVWDFLLKSY